jgi:carnitine-CoA ligase
VNSPPSWAEAVERRARANPDGEIIRRAGEPGLSAGSLLERAIDMASALATHAGAGDAVATAGRSGPTAATVTTALSWLGAVELPLPVGLDPYIARRLITAAGCTLCIATPARLTGESYLGGLTTDLGIPIWTVGGQWENLREVDERTGPRPSRHRASPSDPASVMITSGTGGRPKGAILPNGAGLGQAARVLRAMGYGPCDVLLNIFPWQHVNARHAAFLPAVLSGARLVVDEFSASRFWRTAAAEHVTAFNFMGAVCAMLLRQPPGAGDRAHDAHRAYGGPAPAWLCEAMWQRFGVRLRQAYASTELGDVATTGARIRPGAAGRVVPEYEVRVVTEDGDSVDEDVVGLLEVRPRQTDLTFTRYVGEPDTTRAAWRDGWFVTGDRVRMVDGWLYHEGRRSGTIRRRGLTIDGEQIERAATAHPDVADAAAVGVPSELTEDEVLLVVVPCPGSSPSPRELLRHCADLLPRHAVPRYISIESAVPRTASLKIIHRILRDRGLPAGAWDAEAQINPQEMS